MIFGRLSCFAGREANFLPIFIPFWINELAGIGKIWGGAGTWKNISFGGLFQLR